MPFAPVFVILVAVAGLLSLPILVSVPRLRPLTRFLAPVVAGLCLLGVVAARLEWAEWVVLSRWHPSILFGTSPLLRADAEVWGLALAVTVAAAATSLVQVTRRAQPRFLLAFAVLGIVAALLGSLWAANLLALLLFWGAFDLLQGLGLLAVGATPRRVAVGAGTGLLATAILWAGALLVGAGGGFLSWNVMRPSGLGRDLLLLAGLLRLGVYPLHAALPVGASRSAPAGGVLLLGPALGWGLLLRLTVAAPGALGETSWLPLIGLLTLLVGGFLAWACSEVVGTLPWVALTSAGGVLWAASLAGEAAPATLACGGAAWLLGVTVLHLDRGFSRAAPWWSGGALLGSLALIGAPFTLGACGFAPLLRGVVSPFAVGTVVAFLVGQALLTAALARGLFRPAAGPASGSPLALVAQGTGLALPAVCLLVGGLFPPLFLPGSAAPSLGRVLVAGGVGWLLWLAAVAGGVALFRFEGRFRRRMEPLLSLFFDLFSLDWLLYLLLGTMGRAEQFFRSVAMLIEGAGAVLWALAFFLLAVLILVGR
jgi:hypothetical protein